MEVGTVLTVKGRVVQMPRRLDHPPGFAVDRHGVQIYFCFDMLQTKRLTVSQVLPDINN
jgi:hypothetical protein